MATKEGLKSATFSIGARARRLIDTAFKRQRRGDDQSVSERAGPLLSRLLCRLDNQLYIKLCQHDGWNGLLMTSANRLYEPIRIDQAKPPADFEIIGAVVWHAHSWL